MRVGILSMKGNFDNRLGQGTQRYIYELWKNISQSKPQGVTIEKLELGFGQSNLSHKISFTITLPVQNFNSYNVIHVLHAIPFNPIVDRRRTKIVTTANEFVLLEKDNPFRIALESVKPTLKDLIRDNMAKVSYKQMLHSDYMIAISQKTKEEAIKRGYNKERIFIVNLGLDERFLKPYKKKHKHKVFKVGFLGGFNIRKNAIFAVKAFRKIKDKDIVFELWSRPSGEYNKLVKAAGGDSRIKFKGFAPEDKLIDIYESFDVFVYPSLYAGLELELLEAQSRGVPVIIYKGGNITNEAKYYFAAQDEDDMARIIEKIKKEGFDDKTRVKAANYARTFTWKKTALETIEVYKKIAGS